MPLEYKYRRKSWMILGYLVHSLSLFLSTRYPFIDNKLEGKAQTIFFKYSILRNNIQL